MSIVADTHLHFYPFYNPALGLRRLWENLGKIDGSPTRVGLLAERADCCFFDDLVAGRIELEDETLQPVAGAEPGVVEIRMGGPEQTGGRLFLFAGRQVVTAERIEILALTLSEDIPDGQPARATVEAVLSRGGVPVLAWAPGKWFSGRGRLVRALIEAQGPGSLLLGDTTLRPTVWPEPDLMRLGRERGLGVVAGSDPLPFAGEERRMGTYATRFEGELDLERPVQSMRRVLRGCSPSAPRCGARGGPASVFVRLLRNAMS